MKGLHHRFSGVQESPGIDLFILLKSLFFAFLFMLVSSTLITIVTMYSSWEEPPLLLSGLNYLGIIFGAAYAGRRCHRKIWLHGALVGIGYILLITWVRGELRLLGELMWWKKTFLVTFTGILGSFVGALFRED